MSPKPTNSEEVVTSVKDVPPLTPDNQASELARASVVGFAVANGRTLVTRCGERAPGTRVFAREFAGGMSEMLAFVDSKHLEAVEAQ